MKPQTKIYFIDFDQSLFNTCKKVEGLKLYKEITGKEFPHKDFWNSDESFNDKIFTHIKPYSSIENIIKKANENKDSYVIILTSREEAVREGMMKLLKKHNIKIDELSMRTSKNGFIKSPRILKHLKEFPNAKEVTIIDDNMNLINEKELKETYPNIKFNVYKADEGKLTLQENNIKENKDLSIEDLIDITIKKCLLEDYRNDIRKIWQKPIENLMNVFIENFKKLGIETDNGKISTTDYGISGYIKIRFPDNRIKEIRISDHQVGYNRSNSGMEYIIYPPFNKEKLIELLNKIKTDYNNIKIKTNKPEYAQ